MNTTPTLPGADTGADTDTDATDSTPVTAASAPLAPIAAARRIEALDVVRGFALIGIFLMNIEYFNRPVASMSEGLPRGLTGADFWAAWFVNYFVQGKFWTIFSMLFGMGFAVMMVRAEEAGREFTRVYLRRVFALFVIGSVHYLFIWEGDILVSYAVAAFMLMAVLYAKPKPMLLAIACCVGLGFIPDWGNMFAVASGLALAGLVAIYLRSAKRVRIGRLSMPLMSVLLLLLGVGLSLAAGVLWLLPNAPTGPRVPMTVFGPLLTIFALLSWKYHEPEALRSIRVAVSLYLIGAIAMLANGVVQHYSPDPTVVAPAARSAASAPVPTASAASKKEKTPEQRAAERRAEREKRLAEYQREKNEEVKTFSQGSYIDTLFWRGERYPEKLAGDFGFGVVLIAMFLIGAWFVRSGVIAQSEQHLPFFRRLAFIGLPLGVGLGLLGALITMSHTPGDRYDGWGIARGLSMLGNLPACVGYVGLVVLALHSKGPFSAVRWLAAPGRMALTNYLMQSLLCTYVFYGWGMGQWGMARANQVVFVAAVFGLQVLWSHWWLSRFRYGPMEWVWRGFTYRQVPQLRL